MNNDGYSCRGSDYNLYRDKEERFHILPRETSDALHEPIDPHWQAKGSATELDPLQGADDPSKPLLNKLLAVPGCRARYLGYVRQIAVKWLDWNRLAPIVERYQTLLDADSKPAMSLKDFVEQRQKFLLNHPALQESK